MIVTFGEGVDAYKIVAMVAVTATTTTPALATNYDWTVGGQYDSADVSPSAPSAARKPPTLPFSGA